MERTPRQFCPTCGVAFEVQLCNILIDGAAQLIKWENAIETGEGKAEAEAAIEAMVGGAPAAPAAPVPSSPPLSPPAPPGESGILAGTVSLGVLIGAIAGLIGGCLLLTLCIALVVCCCCRKGKDGKRRTTLGTQARHQQYAVDVNGKTAV